MEIDINDIVAMEKLDSLIMERVEKHIAANPELFNAMVSNDWPMSRLKAELYRKSRENVHAQYWGHS